MRRLRSALLAVAWFAAASRADAANAGLSVFPTGLELDARAPSGSIVLTNDTQEPIRVQVAAQAWSQTRSGEIVLAPTADVIAYPLLATIAPGARQTVRVAVTAAPADRERTYRIVVTQLPSLAGVTAERRDVAFRLRYSMPIRFAPKTSVASHHLDVPRLHRGTLSFDVVDDGTTSAKAANIGVALAGARADLFATVLAPVTVLAGNAVTLSLALPPAACRAAREARVSLDIDGRATARAIAIDPRDCGD